MTNASDAGISDNSLSSFSESDISESLMASCSVSPEELPSKPSSTAMKTSSVTSFLPPCRICGGTASGFHYGANTCEACKAFFRRCTTKDYQAKPCVTSGHCTEIVRGRLVCVSCRFDKCLKVGMTKSGSKKGRYTHERRTQYTNEIKGEAHHIKMQVNPIKEERMSVKREEKSPKVDSPSLGDVIMCEERLNEINRLAAEYFPELCAHMLRKETVDGRINEMLKTSPDIPKEIIYSPGTGDIQLMREFSQNLSEGMSMQKKAFDTVPDSSTPDDHTAVNMLWENWMILAELLFVELTKFAKALSGFNDLDLNDRIILLKGARIEVATFMAHPSCRPDRHMIGLFSAISDELVLIPIGSFPHGGFDSAFNREHNMVMSRLIKANYSLEDMNVIIAFIVLSADREGLKNPAAVEKLQDEMLKVLEYTLKKNHPKSPRKLAETLLILPVLREHSEITRQLLYAGKEETKPDIPPLINEVL